MTPELQLLMHLKQAGYFERSEFDPRPIFQVCRLYLGLDVTVTADNDQLNVMIRRLATDGLIHFEYSPDPKLHPKDSLDYWRIILTPLGASTLENIQTANKT